MDCVCPAPTALTEIPKQDCKVSMGQIQRTAMQRSGYTFDDGDPSTDIKEKATWDALMAASDGTKVVVTPLIGGNPTITAGDPITNGGGDNSTLNGIEENIGTGPAPFSTDFFNLDSEIEKAMKKLACEPNLVVYFFLQGGKIGVMKKSDTTQSGFPAQSFFMSDKNNEGIGANDVNNFRFALAPGWSSDLQIITPNFNPLTEL